MGSTSVNLHGHAVESSMLLPADKRPGSSFMQTLQAPSRDLPNEITLNLQQSHH